MNQPALQPRMPTAPRNRLPANSCDTHAHVFGPPERFALLFPPNYTVPDAPAERYLQMLKSVGNARGVLVQAAPYSTDPGAILAALALARGTLRGIACADASTSDAELRRWSAAGIRGLRFTDMVDAAGRPFAGGISSSVLPTLAPRMREHGLHAQLWAGVDHHVHMLPELVKLGVPLVLDHMGSLQTQRGLDDPGFRQLLQHLARGEIWVKLSVCRVSTHAPDYPELRPFHDALVAANPAQVLWGSDWPYVRLGDAAPDVGALIDLAFAWLPDAKIRQQVFVDNPARLYGF